MAFPYSEYCIIVVRIRNIAVHVNAATVPLNWPSWQAASHKSSPEQQTAIYVGPSE